MNPFYSASKLAAIWYEFELGPEGQQDEQHAQVRPILKEALRATTKYWDKQVELLDTLNSIEKDFPEVKAVGGCSHVRLNIVASKAADIARLCNEVKLMKDFADHAQQIYHDRECELEETIE